jgi:xanthine dehydrogenase accessory factor
MLVTAGAVAGTIGGGHLELKAIESARQRLQRSPARDDVSPGRATGDDTEHFPLGPALGQCCGGAVTVRYLPLDAGVLAHWPQTPPRFHLQLYGAGHVGRAIVQVLRGVPCTVQWIDEREAQFPPPDALADTGEARVERLCVEPVEAEVGLAPAGASYLVLTHSHDLDLRICEAILKRGDFGFLGLIGSRTKRARFVSRLTQRGLPEPLVQRITCPIGLPGIEGKEPGVIAVAAVAQLLALNAESEAAARMSRSLSSDEPPSRDRRPRTT